jgi:2,3-bisphosphoglycerate-dependent phosphoglycerate mutase
MCSASQAARRKVVPPIIRAMSLLLIRHGETALNVARVLQPADTPLSARGVDQAEALAHRLAASGVVRIVSSDLPRALRTAQALAAATGARIETSALLQERNFGDWRGQPYDTLPIDPLTMLEAPPGGESVAAFEQRVAQAFAHIVRRRLALNGNIAVVTHGLVLRAMLAAHVRLPAGMAQPTHLGNTSLSIVEAQPPHAATRVNCTQHLEPGTRDDAHALSGG